MVHLSRLCSDKQLLRSVVDQKGGAYDVLEDNLSKGGGGERKKDVKSITSG